MGRRSVKENKSVYQQTRENLGLTREKAADLIPGFSPERLEKVENGRVQVQPEDVMLFLNLVFQDGALTATTGVSLKQFSLDKSVEIAWDEHAAKFLQRLQA